ncbi:MAG: histidinol dehydrogenase [Candidatus Bathyarchaeia archaeon]|nr:histidinol dehydrogenase [Candidatus Bathyarchaeota archaeon]
MLARIVKLSRIRDQLLRDRWPRKGLDDELLRYVEGIIRGVRERGDKALIEFTERFDGVKLDANRLRVSPEEIEGAYDKVTDKQISAIETAKKRIYEFEKGIISRINLEYTDELGVRVWWKPQPIESVGCYVPGGRYPYPSTLIMTVIPAKVAGVQRVVVCTPPLKDGSIHPLTLIAADMCGVNEIYRVGGAQAVAAMAYGTESIKPVNKIVGPGNQYVMAAKLLVSRIVPIDHPAGPSEIMILADETANSHHVALDMISQMEHGPGCIAILVTTSMRLAERVHEDIMRLAAGAMLDGDAWLLVADSLDEAVSFINCFAPEHLEVITVNAHKLAAEIRSAGLILIGDSTPVSLSDYCLGTNHVIPTGGYGHVYQPLSALDFIKFVRVAECPPEALRALSKAAIVLAESEGLTRHALAISRRVKVDGEKDN